MARVFRATYTIKGPDGQRARRQARKWYVEYRDADGIVRRAPGYVDKAATQQLAARLEREAGRRKEGLGDRYDEHHKRPLREHVEDWHRSLSDKGATARHADLSKQRVLAILDGTKAVFWPDLDANRVATYLADRRKAGLSIESSNHYLRRVKQFARWMTKTGRAESNPLDCLTLQNAKTDHRRVRRVLSADELRELIDNAQNSPKRFGMTGPERAMLYRVAVETGLRSSELRSLTVVSFDLDADPPTVTVGAAYSKRRRDDVLPLRPELATALRTHFAGRTPATRAFNIGTAYHLAKVLQPDLADAGIPYEDEAGRVADFHALRHTFITNLARGGVHPKIAQQLARHSTITLTMERYSHTVLGDLHDALSVLPDLDADPGQRTPQRAVVGIDGPSGEPPTTDESKRGKSRPEGDENRPETLGVLLGVSLAGTAAASHRRESAPDKEDAEGHGDDTAANPSKDGKLDASSRRQSPHGSGWESNPPGAAKRPLNGFEDRGAHQEPGRSLASPRPDIGDCTVLAGSQQTPRRHGRGGEAATLERFRILQMRASSRRQGRRYDGGSDGLVNIDTDTDMSRRRAPRHRAPCFGASVLSFAASPSSIA